MLQASGRASIRALRPSTTSSLRRQKSAIHKLGAHHSDAQTYDTLFLMKQDHREGGRHGDPAKVTAERQLVADQMKGVTFSAFLQQYLLLRSHDAELPGYVIEIKVASGQSSMKLLRTPANDQQ